MELQKHNDLNSVLLEGQEPGGGENSEHHQHQNKYDKHLGEEEAATYTTDSIVCSIVRLL